MEVKEDYFDDGDLGDLGELGELGELEGMVELDLNNVHYWGYLNEEAPLFYIKWINGGSRNNLEVYIGAL